MEKNILDLINEQIWLENHSSCFYLNLSIEFGSRGFNGISKFFFEQAEEERQHMLKLMNYVLDRGEKPIIPQYNYIDDLDDGFDLHLHFSNSLHQEKEVSKLVGKIVYAAREVNDIMTDNYMQWFVNEQREEETKFNDIIDKLKIVGDSGLAIYEIDKELGNMVNQVSTD